jgi:hypothetical protein
MWKGCVTIRDAPQAGQRNFKHRPNTVLICSKSTFKVVHILAEKEISPAKTQRRKGELSILISLCGFASLREKT